MASLASNTENTPANTAPGGLLDSHLEDAPANVEARLLQEAKWAGTEADARKQMSAREVPRVHSTPLRTELDRFRIVEALALFSGMLEPASADEPAEEESAASPLTKLTPDLLRLVVEFAFFGLGPLVPAALDRYEAVTASLKARKPAPFSICARVRPMLEFETSKGEYSVVAVGSGLRKHCLPTAESASAVGSGLRKHCLPTAESASATTPELLCHDAKLVRSGRKLTMSHRHFILDRTLGPESTEADFCAAAVAGPLARALAGRNASVIFYGQTGTGKTYSLLQALGHVSAALASEAAVRVTLFELHGKKCYDLLDNRKPVKLLDNAEGETIVRGALEVAVGGASTVLEALERGLEMRSSVVTERNPVSSRSHAVCRLRLGDRATLTLVDLAGSERKYETVQMTAQMHRESIDINKSLMSLKDCFRAFRSTTAGAAAAGPRDFVPKGRAIYRQHPLTRVLRDCFVSSDHSTTIVAMLSPSTTDMAHTLNSLGHVTMMRKSKETFWTPRVCTVEVPLAGAEALSAKPVAAWTADEVIAWVTTVEGGRFSHVVLPPNTTGQGLLELGKQELAAMFSGQMREADEVRGQGEGASWNVAVVQRRMWGRELFKALREHVRDDNARSLPSWGTSR